MATPDNIRKTVEIVINRVLTDSGRPARTLSDQDVLGRTIGLDSLDLAVTVVGLEQQLGVDPFRESAPSVRTFGELVELYKKARGHVSRGGVKDSK